MKRRLSIFAVALGFLSPLLFSQIIGASGSPYSASAVVGQTNYTNSTANEGNGTTASASSLDGATNVAIDTVHHRLFVADFINQRVLVYLLDSSNNLISTSATYAIGVTSLTSTLNGGSATQNNFWDPFAVAYDSTDNFLFVA